MIGDGQGLLESFCQRLHGQFSNLTHQTLKLSLLYEICMRGVFGQRAIDNSATKRHSEETVFPLKNDSVVDESEPLMGCRLRSVKDQQAVVIFAPSSLRVLTVSGKA